MTQAKWRIFSLFVKAIYFMIADICSSFLAWRKSMYLRLLQPYGSNECLGVTQDFDVVKLCK